MCVGCHGAPGVSRFPITRGLNPEPPSLLTAAKEWKPEELFWIIKYGIKMTAMPAYGIHHSDNELWSIVAFLISLPDLDPDEYLAMLNPVPSDSLSRASADTVHKVTSAQNLRY
jgi:mono/diheme cytochrome c family protein